MPRGDQQRDSTVLLMKPTVKTVKQQVTDTEPRNNLRILGSGREYSINETDHDLRCQVVVGRWPSQPRGASTLVARLKGIFKNKPVDDAVIRKKGDEYKTEMQASVPEREIRYGEGEDTEEDICLERHPWSDDEDMRQSLDFDINRAEDQRRRNQDLARNAQKMDKERSELLKRQQREHIELLEKLEAWRATREVLKKDLNNEPRHP